MITALRIQNLAIVESLEVLFDEGFNVITGETGAGKSLLVDALHLILGGRANLDLVRTGADEACVEALFEGLELDAALDAFGLPTDAGSLLIRRTLSRSGRGRVWINGALSTVGQLEKLAHGLIDISGQHEHVSLLDAELHLGLLDAFADDGELLKRYSVSHAALIDHH
ncbi:MAG: AAA family ATPase [Myxococcales bacterium]|jgi:DNA repair protein RecN (Recombination protein N)|nr:AAA family ATPase [Myxococcales bacterium]